MADNTFFDQGQFNITPAPHYAIDKVADWYDGPGTPVSERYPYEAGISFGQNVLMITNRATGVRSFINQFSGAPYTLAGDRLQGVGIRTMGKAYSIDARGLDQASYWINGTVTAQDCAGATVNDGCASCEIHVYDPDGIVYTKDAGTGPAGSLGAPTTGFRANFGDVIELGTLGMQNFRFNSLNPTASTTVTGAIYVQYYLGTDDFSGFND